MTHCFLTARPRLHLNALTGQLLGIPSGREGTIATLRVMRGMVRQYKKDVSIRALAMELTRGLPQKSWGREVAALHSFVRDQVRYVRDIRGVETVQTPLVTLEMGGGDCDDKSTLLAALLESLGHPSRFVAIGFQRGEFDHVFVETKIADKWVPLETTEPVAVGWSVQNVQSRLIIDN